jgi:hypothetical protein
VSKLTCAPAAVEVVRWPLVDKDHAAAVHASLTDLTRCIDVITVTAVVHLGRRDELVTRLAAALRAIDRVATDLGLDFCPPAAVPPVAHVQDALRELGTELSAVRCAVRCQIDSDMVTLPVTGTRLDATAQWIMAVAAYCQVMPSVLAAASAEPGSPAAALSQGGYCPPTVS